MIAGSYLQYTEEEIEQYYEEFYEDVHEEFLKYGELVSFKVRFCQSFIHLFNPLYFIHLNRYLWSGLQK